MLRSLAIYHGQPGRAARLRRFYGQFIGPGDLCFDIGAHVGDRTRCWSALGARIIAVEPQPDFAALLAWIFRRDPAVTVVDQAAAAAAGEFVLLASSRTPTVSTLSRGWQAAVRRAPSFAGVFWDSSYPVRATTLDALIARYGEPRFCKIDVEGFEAEVLQGLSVPIPLVSFEFNPAAREIALACVDRLMEIGPYRFNLSFGEDLRLVLSDWIDPAAMRSRLEALPQDAGSGDIYARLDRPEQSYRDQAYRGRTY